MSSDLTDKDEEAVLTTLKTETVAIGNKHVCISCRKHWLVVEDQRTGGSRKVKKAKMSLPSRGRKRKVKLPPPLPLLHAKSCGEKRQ
jgi:hypothetical protein